MMKDEFCGYLTPPIRSDVEQRLSPPQFHPRYGRTIHDTLDGGVSGGGGVPLIPDFIDAEMGIGGVDRPPSLMMRSIRRVLAPQPRWVGRDDDNNNDIKNDAMLISEEEEEDGPWNGNLSITSSTDSWMTARPTTALRLDAAYSTWQRIPGRTILCSNSNFNVNLINAPTSHRSEQQDHPTTPTTTSSSAILDACYAKWQQVEPMMVLTERRDDDSNVIADVVVACDDGVDAVNGTIAAEYRRDDETIAARRAARARDRGTKSTTRLFQPEARRHNYKNQRHSTGTENNAPTTTTTTTPPSSALPRELFLSEFFETLERQVASFTAEADASSTVSSEQQQQHQQQPPPKLASKMQLPNVRSMLKAKNRTFMPKAA